MMDWIFFSTTWTKKKVFIKNTSIFKGFYNYIHLLFISKHHSMSNSCCSFLFSNFFALFPFGFVLFFKYLQKLNEKFVIFIKWNFHQVIFKKIVVHKSTPWMTLTYFKFRKCRQPVWSCKIYSLSNVETKVESRMVTRIQSYHKLTWVLANFGNV